PSAPATTAPARAAAPAPTSPATAASPSPVAAASPAAQPAAAAPGGTGQPLTIASLANLSKTLHPYPDNASFTQPWEDAANLIWAADGGVGLLEFDWNKLDYGPAIARDMPQVSA